jgi:hypothetical protein
MDIFDITLLASLCCLIGVAVLFRHRKPVRIVVVVLLLLTTCFSILALDGFSPRLAVSLHEREGGKWSEDFRDGVLSATRVSRPYYPYILVSSMGLALIAIIGPKRKLDDTKPD